MSLVTMKTRDDSLKIGDLASMFGMTARSIRYYEELGLLKSNDRTEGIHRRYPGRNVIYLKRIKQLKAYGLSLGEIKEFFDLAEADPSGERCKALLVRTYEMKIRAEEEAIAAAKARLDELARQADRVRAADSFFTCPGEDCAACADGDYCDYSSFLDDLDSFEKGVTAKGGSVTAKGGNVTAKGGDE